MNRKIKLIFILIAPIVTFLMATSLFLSALTLSEVVENAHMKQIEYVEKYVETLENNEKETLNTDFEQMKFDITKNADKIKKRLYIYLVIFILFSFLITHNIDELYKFKQRKEIKNVIKRYDL